MLHYKYSVANKRKVNDGFHVETSLYRFKNRLNTKYLVELEEYSNKVYALKFYLRKDKDSINKYKFLSREYDAIRIMNTIVSIGVGILSTNPEASFVFIGENSIGEEKSNTKRYKLYKKIASKYFSPINFDHHYNEDVSSYILLNKKSPINIGDIETKFNDYYPTLNE